MARRANVDWNLPETLSWDQVPIAVLMDIRDELKAANALQRRLVSVLECASCIDIPRKLESIKRSTAKTSRLLESKK